MSRKFTEDVYIFGIPSEPINKELKTMGCCCADRFDSIQTRKYSRRIGTNRSEAWSA
jgi:hypothetical protein